MFITFLMDHLQGIAAITSTIIAILGVIIASPRLKRMSNVFRTKVELSTSYYKISNQFTQERSSWQQTIASLQSATDALKSEMAIFKDRLIRVESELERLIPKYRAALHFIHDLRSHIVEKDMPTTPMLLEYDLEQITGEHKV